MSKQAEDWLSTINRTVKGFHKCFKKYSSPYLMLLGSAFGNPRQTSNMQKPFYKTELLKYCWVFRDIEKKRRPIISSRCFEKPFIQEANNWMSGKFKFRYLYYCASILSIIGQTRQRQRRFRWENTNVLGKFSSWLTEMYWIYTFINGGRVLSLLFVELVVPRHSLQSNNQMKNKFSVVLLFVIGI